jgi:hypothetical protein
MSSNHRLFDAQCVAHANCMLFDGGKTTRQKEAPQRYMSAAYSASLFSPVGKAVKIEESHLVTPGNLHMGVTINAYRQGDRLRPVEILSLVSAVLVPSRVSAPASYREDWRR